MIDRIETERLDLRPPAPDDVDALVALDSDPAVMRHINGGRPTPRADVKRMLHESAGYLWIAIERATDDFVGWFSLRPSVAAEYELGYRLHQAAWGRGLATEGSRALVKLAFGDLGAERVWAQTMTVNAASRRVMERCGLRYVRTFHLDWPESIMGTEFGDVEYEILRSRGD